MINKWWKIIIYDRHYIVVQLIVLLVLVHVNWLRRDYLLALFQKDYYLLSQVLSTYSAAMSEQPTDNIIKIARTNRCFVAKMLSQKYDHLSMKLQSILDASPNALDIDRKFVKRLIVITKGEAMACSDLSTAIPSSVEYQVAREESAYWHMRFSRLGEEYRRAKRVAIIESNSLADFILTTWEKI